MRYLAVLALALALALLPYRAATAPEWAGYGDPTAEEQLFLELLNGARMDPDALQKRLGDLTDGGRLTLAPRQPLVINAQLLAACRAHSRDMNDRKYFGHFDPEGNTGGARLRKAGYAWREYQENITAVYEHPADALDRLLLDEGQPDLGHRMNLLALKPQFEAFREMGVGIVSGDGPYKKYYTAVLATDGAASPFVTGAVYRDADKDGAYDPGEGLPGVKLRAEPGAAETKTASAGGYALPLAPGEYTLIASGEALGGDLRARITLTSLNVKTDFAIKPQ